MRFTVVWSAAADEQLAAVWLDEAKLRDQISASANRIDRLLRDDPQDRGLSYDQDWTMEVPPLTVVYSLDEEDRLVRIIMVRLE